MALRARSGNGPELPSMEASQLPTPDTTERADPFDQVLREEREKVREFLQTKQRQLEEAETQLRECLDQFAADTAAEAADELAGEAVGSGPDLQHRYDLAMDDLRELKRENARLQEQLQDQDQARSRFASAPAAGQALDWEAEKRRILAELESEPDEDAAEGQPHTPDVRAIVQRTDEIVAEKDVEIAELKRLLENQSASVGSLAVGAAALGGILDKDAIIQEERQHLAQLQEQWHEKFRRAEVELSIERAKLARERNEIEEKLRLLEQRGQAERDAPAGDAPAEKPPRNRWLTTLRPKDPQ